MIIRLAPKHPLYTWTVGNCGEQFIFTFVKPEHIPELTRALVRFIVEQQRNPDPYTA